VPGLIADFHQIDAALDCGGNQPRRRLCPAKVAGSKTETGGPGLDDHGHISATRTQPHEMGSSCENELAHTKNGVRVGKSQKPNNDGLVGECASLTEGSPREDDYPDLPASLRRAPVSLRPPASCRDACEFEVDTRRAGDADAILPRRKVIHLRAVRREIVAHVQPRRAVVRQRLEINNRAEASGDYNGDVLAAFEREGRSRRADIRVLDALGGGDRHQISAVVQLHPGAMRHRPG
jgi:hypothetical protein